MTEERDSQLSAMFDDELPAGECELLARRLARDEALRSQWSRFSTIGAALRAERGVALHDRVAFRVQAVIAQEVTYGEGTAVDAARPVATPAAKAGRQRWMRFGYPVAGASIAAGVAAVSIFWLRGVQEPGDVSLQASSAAPTTRIVLAPEPEATTVAMNNSAEQGAGTSSGEPDRYSTPAPNSATSFAPPARLANYVVAHSEYSGPLTRRMALLGIVGAEAGSEPDGSGTAAPEAAPAEQNNAP